MISAQWMSQEVAEGDREGVSWLQVNRNQANIALSDISWLLLILKKYVPGKGDPSCHFSVGFLLTKEVIVRWYQESLSLGHKWMPNTHSSREYESLRGLESIQPILTSKKLPSNTLFVFLGGGTQETLISFHTIIHHNQRGTARAAPSPSCWLHQRLAAQIQFYDVNLGLPLRNFLWGIWFFSGFHFKNDFLHPQSIKICFHQKTLSW